MKRNPMLYIFYIYFKRYQVCRKQVVTADDKNAPPPSLFEDQWPNHSFSSHCTLKSDFDECKGFSCSACGFFSN
jgi:hypothetical protein